MRVDDAPAGTMMGGADLAIAADGTLVVSWVDRRDGSARVRVSKSTDGGGSWGASVGVGGGVVPVVSSWAHPFVDANGSWVAVMGAFTDAGKYKSYGYKGSLATLTFQDPIIAGTGSVGLSKGALTADGDLWMLWLAFGTSDAVSLEYGDPSRGYGGVKVGTNLAGEPCDCCPVDIRFGGDGSPLLSWRHNVENIRNMGFASGGAGGPVGDGVFATSTDWEIFACPTQGPRSLELADGSLFMTWSDGSSGTSRAYGAKRVDGEGWGSEVQVAGGVEGSQITPTAAQGESGTVYVSCISAGEGGSILTRSTDGGESFAEAEALVSPGGRLTGVELEGVGGVTGWAGTAMKDGVADSVWFARLE